MIRSLTIIITSLLIFGCSRKQSSDHNSQNGEKIQTEANTPTGTGLEDSVDVYTVKGTVKSLPPGGKFIIIDHEKIPGLMNAMEMPFYLENPEVAKGVEPDNRISFTFEVASGRMTVTKIEKLK